MIGLINGIIDRIEYFGYALAGLPAINRKDYAVSVDGVVKRTSEEGRIVITLEYTVDKKWWPVYAEDLGVKPTDAVDCLRQDVINYQNGLLGLADLIESADSVKVEATK